MALPQLSRRTTSLITTLLVLLAALAVWWLQGGSVGEDGADDPGARQTTASTSTAPSPTGGMPSYDEVSGLPYVALGDLPPEAAETVDLIDAGGPFPYEKDGSRFGNYEGLLPDREDGYYEEYTVETPGSPDRGARRIVAGAGGELYWTEDHYESFEVIWR